MPAQRFAALQAVGPLNSAHFQHTGNVDLIRNAPSRNPADQLETALQAVKHHVVARFLAAGENGRLFVRQILTRCIKAIHIINQTFQLTRKIVPVQRRGEYNTVRAQQHRRNFIEIRIPAARPILRGIASAAGNTVRFPVCGINFYSSVPRLFCTADKSVRHLLRIAASAGAAQQNRNFLPHLQTHPFSFVTPESSSAPGRQI